MVRRRVFRMLLPALRLPAVRLPALRLVAMLLLAVLLAAACEKPGEGAKAEAWYAAARPIIASLNSYHQDVGRYPQELSALVPVYLTEVPKGPDGQPFEYKWIAPGTSYSLTFRYAGPGMNICAYTPETAWRCYGYY